MTPQANPITLVDSHCHLDKLDLTPYNGELTGALDAARDAGVRQFLAIATDITDAPAIVEISRAHPDVVYAIGVHPLRHREEEASLEELREAVDTFEPVAVGEIGLDYIASDGKAPRVPVEVQRERFERHLAVARQAELPVIIHTRGAKEDTLALLEQYVDPAVGGVLHCFTDDLDMARRAIRLGFYISLSGIVTFNQADNVRELARLLPLDRLLIETDSPYLAPVPHRGTANEPRHVVEVARMIAEMRGISMDEVAMQTSANFYHLFRHAVPQMPEDVQSRLGHINHTMNA